METVDVIILSNTANLEYYRKLEKCVKSLKSNSNIETNIIVIETNKKLRGKDIKLPIDTFYIPEDAEFNYNKFLNYGLTFCKHDYLCISNNDVYYNIDVLYTLVKHLDEYDSVSPWDDNSTWRFHQTKGIHVGYSTRMFVTGWCIVTKKSTIDKIGGKFDERFSFWFQDDDYSKLLESNNLTHALIGDVSVWHDCGQSHELFSEEDRQKQTHGLSKVFDEKWK
jgi:hypothetical protein